MSNFPTQYQALYNLYANDRPTETAPLLSPDIDDRSEAQLLEDAIALVREKSEGKLNDFTIGSPTRALLSGHALIAAKIGYFANQAAHKATIEFLQIAGVQRVTGKAATCTLLFRITGQLSGAFSVPQGYRVRAGSITFVTSQALVIPAGSITGEVLAIATTTGAEGNVQAQKVRSPLQPLAFLRSVTNPLPATGGEDAESEQQTIARGFVALRSRSLVSQWDYEEFVRNTLGRDTVCRAYGDINQAGKFTELPQVLIAACKATGKALTEPQKSTLISAMGLKGHIKVAHYIRDLDVTVLDIRAIIGVLPNFDKDVVGKAVYDALRAFISVKEDWINKQLIANELEWRVRNVPGVEQVDMLFFGKSGEISSLDSYHTGLFETLNLGNLTLTVLQSGQSFVLPYGLGDPD